MALARTISVAEQIRSQRISTRGPVRYLLGRRQAPALSTKSLATPPVRSPRYSFHAHLRSETFPAQPERPERSFSDYNNCRCDWHENKCGTRACGRSNVQTIFLFSKLVFLSFGSARGSGRRGFGTRIDRLQIQALGIGIPAERTRQAPLNQEWTDDCLESAVGRFEIRNK